MGAVLEPLEPLEPLLERLRFRLALFFLVEPCFFPAFLEPVVPVGPVGAWGGGVCADVVLLLLSPPPHAANKSAQDQVSYTAALDVCKKRPLNEIRAVYKPKGKSPDAIAKAVSKFYHPPHRAQAAYNGCLKGLSQR